MERGFIICVDDQPAILDSLMTQLETSVGDLYEIETAESADEALELLDDLKETGQLVEMIITDEVMPGMKGSQLLEVVHKRCPDVIKVMLTGQAGLNSVAYAINNAGLDQYITKPWQYEDLHLTIGNLLAKARLTRKNQTLTQALKEKYQELQQTHEELTQAYKRLKETQEQLIHAEKLSLIGQLSSGIAHEVKNQLNMIGFAELIQTTYPDDEKLQKYAGYILKAGKNIYNLIDEMRRFAKKEHRQYAMEMSSLTDVLEKLLNFFRFDKLLKQREIITDFQSQPLVLLNDDKFGQVMVNLLRNAAHATSDEIGKIHIRVTTHANNAQVTVQDNGCGISEEHLEHIWEPFFTTKGDDGTGLGLDICKRIIEEHQGTITCTSQVNVGTTFTISLPAIEKKSDT